MLDGIDELKKMILELMKNQSEMNKRLEKMKKEIQDTQQEMKKEIQDTKQEIRKEIEPLIQRLKKLEDSFKNSRNAQIECFKDLISKMEKLDL